MNTLKIHLKNIYAKLEIKSRYELYCLADITGGQNKMLTGREKQILASLLSERSIEDIAAELYISKKTVYVHIWNICNKCNVKNIRELKEFAVK